MVGSIYKMKKKLTKFMDTFIHEDDDFKRRVRTCSGQTLIELY